MSRLIRLYPAAWRDRYAAEFSALLEERSPSAGDTIDILRGAIDAHVHPQAIGAAPQPWTHRLPGLLALAGGLIFTVTALILASGWPGTGPEGIGEYLGVAAMLMLVSLPGDYLARHGRRLATGFAALTISIVAVHAFGWSVPAFILGIAVYVVGVSGVLAMAAIRAGIAPAGRWLLIGGTVLAPVGLALGIGLARLVTGIVVVPDGAPVSFLLLLPFGLAWLFIGVRMTARGAPTFVDPPTTPLATEAVAP